MEQVIQRDLLGYMISGIYKNSNKNRYEKHILEIKHHYKLPINTIKFHEKTRMVLTSSKKIIKINNKDSGSVFTNIEPKSEINRFELVPNSGMILTASDEPRIGIFFVP